MPQNVRNAWIQVRVDGRKSEIATGPRARNGGMIARFYVRHNGSVTPSVTVETMADDPTDPDRLTLRIWAPDGALIYAHETLR